MNKNYTTKCINTIARLCLLFLMFLICLTTVPIVIKYKILDYIVTIVIGLIGGLSGYSIFMLIYYAARGNER